ncbi:Protein disulfide-isomerase A4 [Nymphon striatum]|nr:Protein disulfide-isomerase A4 [Nymphon striatum]
MPRMDGSTTDYDMDWTTNTRKWKNPLRIGSWNVRSLYRAGYSNTLVDEVKSYSLDIVALQEVAERDLMRGKTAANLWNEDLDLLCVELDAKEEKEKEENKGKKEDKSQKKLDDVFKAMEQGEGQSLANRLGDTPDKIEKKKKSPVKILFFHSYKSPRQKSRDTIAKHCDFHDKHKEVKSQIIQKCLNPKIREKGISETNISLEQLLMYGRTLEANTEHTKAMGSQGISPLVLDTNRICSKPCPATTPSQPSHNKGFTNKRCPGCGGSQHNRRACPAWGKHCNKCNKLNHFAKVCFQAAHNHYVANKNETNDTDQIDYHMNTEYQHLYHTNFREYKNNSNPYTRVVRINDHPVSMEIDTGAASTIISSEQAQALGPLHLDSHNLPTLRTYTGHTLTPDSRAHVTVVYGNQTYQLRCLVVSGKGPNLLGRDWLAKIRLNWANTHWVDQEEDFAKLFPQLFLPGLGTLKGVKAQLHLADNVKPRCFKPRSVPFALRTQPALHPAVITSMPSTSSHPAVITSVPLTTPSQVFSDISDQAVSNQPPGNSADPESDIVQPQPKEEILDSVEVLQYSSDEILLNLGLKGGQIVRIRNGIKQLSSKKDSSIREPQRILLGRYHTKARRGHKLVNIQNSNEAFYIPLVESLEQLLNDDSILEEVQNCHRRTDDLMCDFCDGDIYKDHPLFGRDPYALQIIIYFDELEVCNPLGSRATKHKIGAFYYTLGNIDPKNRSHTNAIQLLGLMLNKNIKKYGVEPILEAFLSDLHLLERDNGYEFTIGGQPRTFRGSIAYCSGDNLGSQLLGGFKQGSQSHRRCRVCMGDPDTLQTHSLSFQLNKQDTRTFEYYPVFLPNRNCFLPVTLIVWTISSSEDCFRNKDIYLCLESPKNVPPQCDPEITNTQVYCDNDGDILGESEEDIPVVEGHGGDIHIVEESDVLVLNQDNFDLITKSRDLLLVEFYAPWCGHCKQLEPEYAKAAAELKKLDPPIEIAKLDVTQAEEIGRRYDVKGYPTMLLFKKGEVFEKYAEDRSYLAIVEFMKKRSDPNYTPPPKRVMELTKDNFQSKIDNSKMILVLFTSKNCEICEELAPRYEQAAQELDVFHPAIPLAKINSDKYEGLADKYNITEYPSFKIFRYGRVFDYNGPKENQGMVPFMKKESSHPSSEVKNNQQLRNGLSRYGLSVVGFFSDDSSSFYKEFVATAYIYRDVFPFSHTFSKDVADSFQEKMDTIALFKPEIFQSKYEESRYRISDSDMQADMIKTFIEENKVPLVGQRTKKNMDSYSSRPLCVIYYDVNFSHEYRIASQLVRNQILNVAKDFKDITFALSNEDEFKDEIEALGLFDSSEDVNAGLFYSNTKRFVLNPSEEFDADVLRSFLKDGIAGKLKPLLKSQPIPKKNDGPVKKVVANNFDEIVVQSPKNVFLEFYAPWCGYCQRLAPTYKQLGEKYLEEKSLTIAQMDATANDLDDMFTVDGYPTMYFLKSGSKSNPIPYVGEKTLEAMSKFLDEHLEKQKDEL